MGRSPTGTRTRGPFFQDAAKRPTKEAATAAGLIHPYPSSLPEKISCCPARRLPSSSAATTEDDLAWPIPLKAHSSSMPSSDSRHKLKSTLASIRPAKATADSRGAPEPISIATSSASAMASLPFSASFSLGRRCSSQPLMPDAG